jgi:hypothetical protein
MRSWYVPPNVSIENFEGFKLIPPRFQALDDYVNSLDEQFRQRVA